MIHEELLLLAEHLSFDRDVAAHPALPQDLVSLSHRMGFARHSYDETKRGNVTDYERVSGREPAHFLTEERSHWLKRYCLGAGFPYLKENAPFIAYELKRQNLVEDIKTMMAFKPEQED